jgi:hypothetical protein
MTHRKGAEEVHVGVRWKPDSPCGSSRNVCCEHPDKLFCASPNGPLVGTLLLTSYLAVMRLQRIWYGTRISDGEDSFVEIYDVR